MSPSFVLSARRAAWSLHVAYALIEDRTLTAQHPVSFRSREIRIWLRRIVLPNASWAGTGHSSRPSVDESVFHRFQCSESNDCLDFFIILLQRRGCRSGHIKCH